MRFRRRKKPTAIDYLRFHDRVTLRVYSNGAVIMGPLSLSDLAMFVRYGGYQGEGETSILHIPTPFGVTHPELDITVECIGDERF